MMRTAKFAHPVHARGAAAVEFALVMILLLMIAAGIVEFGRAFWYYDALTKATRDGARVMSVADKSTISSTAVPEAKSLVVAAANNARVSPPLTDANVLVECMNTTVYEDCADGTAPVNVRVSIVDAHVTIGGWIPLLFPTGGAATFDTELAPFNTQRYML